MTGTGNQWHIEIRASRIPESGGTNLAHTYVAFVDAAGNDVAVFHGFAADPAPPGTVGEDLTGTMVPLGIALGGDHALRMFEYPSSAPVERTWLGPDRVHYPPIWVGSESEGRMIRDAVRTAGHVIAQSDPRYQAADLGLSDGDAVNSNAMTRTVVDLVRHLSTANGWGHYGLPSGYAWDYWPAEKEERFGNEARFSEVIRLAEATGIPPELLDDSLAIGSGGTAVQAPGLGRNLLVGDVETGAAPDPAGPVPGYPPALAPLFAPPSPRAWVAPLAHPKHDGKGPSEAGRRGGDGPSAPQARGGGDPSSTPAGEPDAGAPTGAEASHRPPSGDGPFARQLAAAMQSPLERILTVPEPAISAVQRDALMADPAFSDGGHPLFGAATAKYRQANMAGAERAVAGGAVDVFGRPQRPLFAATDGTPADADGRPLADSARALGARLDTAAAETDPATAVSALQRTLNRLGDDEVAAETPPDGVQARRRVPKLAIDGVLGPKTKRAALLALHQWGPEALSREFATKDMHNGRAA